MCAERSFPGQGRWITVAVIQLPLPPDRSDRDSQALADQILSKYCEKVSPVIWLCPPSEHSPQVINCSPKIYSVVTDVLALSIDNASALPWRGLTHVVSPGQYLKAQLFSAKYLQTEVSSLCQDLSGFFLLFYFWLNHTQHKLYSKNILIIHYKLIN